MYRIKLALFFPLCFLFIAGYSQTQTHYYVSTLAGDTTNVSMQLDSNSGYRDGAGSQALFNNPVGLALNTAGTFLYVADASNNLIRKITIANGMVTTVAGDTADLRKYGPDSNEGFVNAASAFAAQFNSPLGVCVDDTGNVYVADTYNNVIRKIWVSGKVTTYAGRDSAGLGVSGYINGLDSVAEFFAPTSLSIDSAGNIYVADYGNNAIREILKSGTVTTLAGQGPDSSGYTNGPIDTAQFYGLFGMAIGKAGAIFATQAIAGSNAVRRVYNDTVTTYAGYDTVGIDTNVFSELSIPTGYQNGFQYVYEDSLEVNSLDDTIYVEVRGVLFNDPTGIAFDTLGNLLIADEFNNVIRIFNASDSLVSTFAGNDSVGNPGFVNGPDSIAQFYQPMGVAADKKGNFFVADLGNNLIREISINPNPTGIATVTKPSYTLTAYPNPCADRLNIVSSFNGQATLLDVTGRPVWTDNNFKSPYTLPTSDISPGIYFLRIISPSVTEIKKVEVLR